MSVADGLYYLGLASVVAGVAMMHVPAALVVGGVLACCAGYFLQESNQMTEPAADGKETDDR